MSASRDGIAAALPRNDGGRGILQGIIHPWIVVALPRNDGRRIFRRAWRQISSLRRILHLRSGWQNAIVNYDLTQGVKVKILKGLGKVWILC